MKSDAIPVPERPPLPREKPPLNPWLLVFITVGLFLTLVIVGLPLLALLAPQTSLRTNEFALPDGKVLRIEAVTWGRNHRLDYEYTPPGSWAFWDRRRTPITHGAGVDQLMVWMTCHDGRTGRALDFDWWSGSSAVDANGDELPDRVPFLQQFGARGSSSGGGSRPFRADRSSYDTWIVSSSFPAFRTNGGRFELRVKNLAGEVVATVPLTHPSPPAIQTWTPEELPATKSSGDVSVTLQRLNAHSSKSITNGVETTWWYYSPQGTVSVNSQPAPDWHVNLLEIFDPLGNQQNYGHALSRREPVWKVRVGAFRGQSSKFPASETWCLTNLEVPQKNAAVPRSEAQTIDGVTVTLVALAGSGKTSYSIATPSLPRSGNFSSRSGGSAFGSSTKIESNRIGSTATSIVEANWPHLTLELAGNSPLHRVYLLAKDDQSRDVPTQFSNNYGALHSYFFKTEPDAKSLTLSIIVHKGREFEFFIKPPEHPEDKPMP